MFSSAFCKISDILWNKIITAFLLEGNHCIFVHHDRLILDTYDSGHIKYEWVKESGLKIMDKTMAQFELTSYHTEKIEHKYSAGIRCIGSR